MSFQRRLATAPWPAHVLFVLVVGGVVLGVLSVVNTGSDNPDLRPVYVVLWLVTAVAAPVVAVVRRRRLRAAGRWEAVLDATDAFQQRRAPVHPAVRYELAKVAATNRRVMGVIRWGPLLFGPLAVLTAVAAVHEPRQWVLAVVFAGVAAAYPVLYRRIRARVEAAERVLR
jgi:hypothetical protein